MIAPKNKIGQQPVVVTSSVDKHKLWLVFGIVLTVVLVLLLVFLSPARQALFGKAVFAAYNTPSAGQTNNYALRVDNRFSIYIPPRERCGNHLDDDNDTLIDCNDADCVTNESCVSVSSGSVAAKGVIIPPVRLKNICMNIQLLPFYSSKNQ